MSNPVSEFFEAKTAAQAQRKAKDQSLWETWKTNGQQPQHLTPLLKEYQGVFAQKMKQKPPKVPASAYHAELQTLFIKALESYDPSQAALNTHVEQRLKKATRYGNRYANVAYIPEEKARLIGKIDKSTEILGDELGRQPTPAEIARHLSTQGKPVREKQVRDVMGSRIHDVNTSQLAHDPTSLHSSFEEQQIALAQHILPDIFPNKPEIHELFHYTFGTGGKPQVHSTTELAKIMGKSQSQISRMKTVMGNTLKQYMGPGQNNKD